MTRPFPARQRGACDWENVREGEVIEVDLGKYVTGSDVTYEVVDGDAKVVGHTLVWTGINEKVDQIKIEASFEAKGSPTVTKTFEFYFKEIDMPKPSLWMRIKGRVKSAINEAAYWVADRTE